MTRDTTQYDQPVLGMAYMCAGLMIVPGIDVIAKILMPDLSSGEIAWWRFTLQLIMLTPLLFVMRAWKWQGHLMFWQLLPGIFAALETTLFFYALQYMSMAKTITIFFVEPMIITILAALFLGEVIRARRIIAIIVGFIGVAIVIRPQGFQFEWFVLLPLLSATCFAIFFLLLRKIAKQAHPLMTLWMVSWGAVITLSLLLQLPRLGFENPIFTLQGITSEHIVWVLAMGVIAIIGHSLLISASSQAPTSLLAPLAYLELVSAATMGYVLFDETPDRFTIMGGAIIIGSGLYLIYREHQLHKAVSSDIPTAIN